MPNIDSQILSDRARAELAAKISQTGEGVNTDYVSLTTGVKPDDYVADTGLQIGSYPIAEGVVQRVKWNTTTDEWDDFGPAYISVEGAKVSSVASLKTRRGVIDGQTIELLGYYEKSDGGGGTFFWDGTSTRADNKGTVFQVTGVSVGRWIRVNEISDTVNIKWFGCKTDGSDITESYESARSWVVGRRAKLYAPIGEYSFSGLINVTSNSSLIGDSPSFGQGFGTVFKKISSSAKFRVDHSTVCRDFGIDANGYATGVDTEQVVGGTTAGVKFCTMDNIWVNNYTERAFNFNNYSFNLTMIAPKTRPLNTAEDPISLYLRHEDSITGELTGLTSPAISIINPSFYGISQTEPRGTAIVARGCNGFHFSGGEFANFRRWFVFRDCEVTMNSVDFEYNTAPSIIDDSQVVINSGIIHTYREGADGYELTDLPFTSSRRLFFIVKRTTKSSNLTIDSVEFRNTIGLRSGDPDNNFSIVGLELNLLNDTTEQSTVNIKNESYQFGNFGNKIVGQLEDGSLAPLVQLGRNKRIVIFKKMFQNETGDVNLTHAEDEVLYACSNKSIVRAYFYKEKGSPLTNSTNLKCFTYDSSKTLIDSFTIGTISASPDSSLRTGYSKFVELKIPRNGFFRVVASSSTLTEGTGIVIYAQVEEV